MKDKNLVLQKLKEARDTIPEIKSGGLKFRDSSKFKAWWDNTCKWLRRGADHTSNESISFANLDFTGRASHFHHDPSYDLKLYQEGCDWAKIYLDSAIENIENNLVNRPSVKHEPKKEEEGGLNPREVNIQSAGKVIVGDSNTFRIVQSISIREVLKALENEIEAKVSDPAERKGLHKKINGILQSPLTNTILSQSLSEFLKKSFD
ncbi:MAG: hypothetical protein ACHQYP_02975 [Nitrospiria bacterium]